GFRATSENLGSTISDVVTKGVSKSLSEVVSIAVSLSKGAGKFPLESVVPSDVLARVFTGFRTTSEDFGSAISAEVTKVVRKSISEARQLSSTSRILVTTFNGLTLSTAVSIAVAIIFTGVRSLPETPTASDVASRVFTGFRTTSDSLASAISDVVNKGVARSL